MSFRRVRRKKIENIKSGLLEQGRGRDEGKEEMG